MKKANFQYKTYIPLSRLESALLNATSEITLFSISHVQRLTGWKTATIRNTLHSLKKKKVLAHLGNNRYVLSEKIAENLFAIATSARPPSYISFWTACSYYGYTEQQVKAIQVVSTKQYPSLKIASYLVETTTILPGKFFGYQKVDAFAIAEKEKLLIDILYKPELGGGIGEVKKCIRAMWPEISQRLVVEYLLKFNNKSCFARLGYLLDTMQLKNTISKFLLKNAPKCFVKLNPRKQRTKKYSQKWRININDQ